MRREGRPLGTGARTTGRVDTSDLSGCPPGGVPEGHPGLTLRVKRAIAIAEMTWIHHPITDASGPHLHHWEPILWCCRGCGAFDPPYDDEADS